MSETATETGKGKGKKTIVTKTDDEILEAIDKHKTAGKICEELGIKIWTLRTRVARLMAEKKQYIEIEGLWNRKPGKVGERKDPTVIQNGYLALSPAWMKDSGFKVGDSFSVKFAKDRITLTVKR